MHKTALEFWRNMMATNLDGAFLTMCESLNSLRQTDWGRVIAVSSVAGLRGLPGGACYTASKHGLIGLMRALSKDYTDRPDHLNRRWPDVALWTGLVEQDTSYRNALSLKYPMESS